MCIIFLDVDGVLNCDTTEIKTKSGNDFIEDYLIQKLVNIIVETNAKVVLSSDWRLDRYDSDFNSDYLELKAKLEEYNIQFYGWTPIICGTNHHFNLTRGMEIAAWLKEHPDVKNFVILDDRHDMQPHMEKLVQTDFRVGLTDEDVQLAIKILKGID